METTTFKLNKSHSPCKKYYLFSISFSVLYMGRRILLGETTLIMDERLMVKMKCYNVMKQDESIRQE